MLLRRRRRRAVAVVGLLAGLALLLGAVLDGGPTTPTRTDPAGAAAAVPPGHLGAPPVQPREDHRTWGQTVPSSRIAVVVLAALLALGTTALTGPALVVGPRHRAPALRAARHRGPPIVV
ncbi:MAG TPA: hypothetical protein VGO60_03625 [Iamia sp.]|jgi:hypothetical protein|nr:hypothetical protein [Iamia sp.]